MSMSNNPQTAPDKSHRVLRLDPDQTTQYTEERAALLHWMSVNLVEEIDFGPGRPGAKKNTLLKPGAEKLCLLFGWRVVFVPDKAIHDMLGSPPDLVCIECDLYESGQSEGRYNETPIGEGRGAASVTERTNMTHNNAVKMAEKRAQVDAVLRAVGISDIFTQDLEDQVETLERGEKGMPSPELQAERDTLIGMRKTIRGYKERLDIGQEAFDMRVRQLFGAVKFNDLNIDQLTILADKMKTAIDMRFPQETR